MLCLDDVIVYFPTFKSHIERLTSVLNRFREADMKLKPGMCTLFQEKVTFLGHVVSAEGVATDPEKGQAVTHWLTPSKQKEVWTFLGFVSY